MLTLRLLPSSYATVLSTANAMSGFNLQRRTYGSLYWQAMKYCGVGIPGFILSHRFIAQPNWFELCQTI